MNTQIREIVSKKSFDFQNTDKLTTMTEFVNEITELMDRFLVCEWRKVIRKGYVGGTYMLFKMKESVAIRFPGATRGHVSIDENQIITGFKFYDDIDPIYKKALKKELDKYIGCKLVIPDGIKLWDGGMDYNA